MEKEFIDLLDGFCLKLVYLSLQEKDKRLEALMDKCIHDVSQFYILIERRCQENGVRNSSKNC